MEKKQLLTNKEIEKDIITALKNPHKESEESYKKGTIPAIIVAVFLFVLGFIYPEFLPWVAISVFLFVVVYTIFCYVRLGAKIKRVSIGNYEIKTEVVSHTYSESYVAKGAKYHSERINNYTLHFEDGKKWDVPKDNYLWSVERRMSDFAIYNSSHRGDEFIVVTKRETGDVVMAYNTEFFEYKN